MLSVLRSFALIDCVKVERDGLCSPYSVARLRAPTPKLLHCATASIKIRHHCAPTAYRVLPRACFTPGCASSCVLLVPLQGASKAGFVGRARRRSRRRALIQAILQKKQAELPEGKKLETSWPKRVCYAAAAAGTEQQTRCDNTHQS